MHFFFELLTVAFTALTGWHAWRLRGGDGLWLFSSLLVLGTLRENFVALAQWLYGFAPLRLRAGAAPMIAAVVWAFSIYAALCWVEEVSGEQWRVAGWRPTWRFFVLVAIFMMALACLYEPFLALIRMARWEEGTWKMGGVPVIALVGYPSLAVAFLAAFAALGRRLRRGGPLLAGLAVMVPLLAFAHAWGLQALKRALGW
ncbi:MAG TPA: hypothetical protein VGS57_00950 [Thermoanaerobaculia bacterium]|jgi:hypothetical protein|nr:hypothetical protein [Thermoanaerobaculia bacterium]